MSEPASRIWGLVREGRLSVEDANAAMSDAAIYGTVFLKAVTGTDRYVRADPTSVLVPGVGDLLHSAQRSAQGP